MADNTITWKEFEKLEIRVGTIQRAEDFPEARKPAYKIWVDLGPDIGVKKSSAQITGNYSKADLIGQQVLCVVNFPEKQIGPFISQVLITGFTDEKGAVVLAVPKSNVPNGSRLH
ncbi:tRNA-binding protein [Fulvivirga sedimenti]|uniref:tRNA-binding protein n=1 Tax=Fulvivirga sedimenti TaxID=2879465 RepID=A0A9X1KZM6_9BACT|nr:tRNA-binding protein [Fulvivirga sedimenti]MCA6078455.1 tRNA-binding protein [Fulvivirga sedimenti]